MSYSQIWTNSTAAHPLAITVSPTANRILVLAVITDNADGATFTFPSGFSTPVTVQSTYDNTDLAVAYKVATGSETSLSVSNTNARSMIGFCTEHSSIDTTTPLDVAIVTGGSSTAGTTIALAATPVTSGADLISIHDADTTGTNVTFSWATTSGTTGAWTQRADLHNGGFFNLGVGTATQTTAGAFTVTSTQTGESSGRVGALVVLRPTSAGGSTGTVNRTNSNDTLSASGTTTVRGTIARTNTNDSISSAGTTTVIGTVSRTNTNDSISAQGSTTVRGTLAVTNQNDTASVSGSVGSPVSGTVAVTNTNDTSSIQGTTTIVSTVARTNANDTSSASGTTTILSTLSRTNSNDTLSASGSVGSAASGSVNRTNQNDTVSANGSTTIIATLTRTNLNDIISALGTTTIQGTLVRTNQNDTITASGSSGTPPAGAATRLPLTGVGS